MEIEVHDPTIHITRLLKFADKIDDRKFRRIAQIAHRTFLGSVIFMNLFIWV